MGKAILVMDMPSSCFECPLGKNESIPLETAIVCMAKSKWVTDKQCESKPEWCPLREVPHKTDFRKAKTETVMNWIEGYNACIDEIMKGGAE